PVAGWPTVLMDDRGGMAEAVSHLIEAHGQRRIGFVRGPDNHGGAQQRYQGYLDALDAHGLAVDPDLITAPGDWNWDPDIAAEAERIVLRTLSPRELADRPDAVAAEIRAVLGTGAASLPEHWATRLVATFLDAAAGGTDAGFLPLLDEYVRGSARIGCEPTRW